MKFVIEGKEGQTEPVVKLNLEYLTEGVLLRINGKRALLFKEDPARPGQVFLDSCAEGWEALMGKYTEIRCALPAVLTERLV